MNGIYTAFASVMKYIFITIIYIFIYAIIKMIFLDIRKLEKAKKPSGVPKGVSYLELVSNSSKLYFDVENAYLLDKELLLIGRGESCDISINDLYMSSKHAQIWFDEGDWCISDLGSTNGTYINGERMTEDSLILDNGDKIRIGQVEFVVVIV